MEKVLWKIVVTQHSLPLHQEMQLEIVICKDNLKKKFLHRTPSSLGPKSSEMEKTVKTCSLVRRVHISACFWKKTDIRFYVPKMKYTLYAVTNEKCKNQPLWWYGGSSASRRWWSAYTWRYHWCRGLCWLNFGETYAAIKMTTFPISISARQGQASFCMGYNSVTS